MTATLLDLATQFELQADPVVVEKKSGDMSIVVSVNPGCEDRASRAAMDFLGAHDHSAFHAAREVAIDSVRTAQNEGCAMKLVVTR